MNLIDEYGRCRLSDFVPTWCGCQHHRGRYLTEADWAIIRAMQREANQAVASNDQP